MTEGQEIWRVGGQEAERRGCRDDWQARQLESEQDGK